MLPRPISLALPIVLAIAGMCFSVPARATPSKQECVDDNAAAQELRRQGHFADASDHLERCAVPSCPAIVRDDCARRLDDLKLAQPTLVFEVRTPSGKDIIAVRVSLDGQLFTDHLDGTPLKVDPGPHAFTFDVAGAPAVTEGLLIREGEAGRHERVVIEGVSPPTVTAVAPIPSAMPRAPASQSSAPRTRQVIGLSAAGLGAVGAVVGAVFGVMAKSAWSEAKTDCGGDPSHCDNPSSASSRRSQALTDATVSTAALITGAALFAGGAFFYLTAGERRESKTEGVAVSAAVDSGQVGFVLVGAF